METGCRGEILLSVRIVMCLEDDEVVILFSFWLSDCDDKYGGL